LISLFILLFLCQGCVADTGTSELKERTYRMPGSILQAIRKAVQDGNFSCDKKSLLSRDFFELKDKRLLVLIGIPDYLCASNSFLPVTVDDQGKWLAGPILPGAPSWIATGPDNSLWLAAQWQVEGTFPALYRSLDGVDWQEIKLPENRAVDCCFERLERICFQQGIVRLKFAGAVAGKTTCWEARIAGIAGAGPAWKRSADAPGCGHMATCPFDRLGQGSWTRKGPDRSGGIVFARSDRHEKIAVVIPGSLE
jgi:hypothetical protein